MSSDDNTIVSATAFKPSSNVGYAKPKTNKSGGKSINIINTNTKQSLYLSTPLMLTWGAQMFVDEHTGRKSYTMSVQFPRDDFKNEQTNQFLEVMKEFEAKVKADAMENSKEWLNRTKVTAEVIDALFSPMLKYPKDPNTGEPDLTRAPFLSVKLDYWDDAFNFEIYDMDQKILFPLSDASGPGPMELITKGSNAAVVIRCGGIWFASGKFGVTWRLVQAVVKPRDSMKGRCLIKLSGDDKKTLENQETESEDGEKNTVAVTMTEDSESEEDDEAPKTTFFEPPTEVKKVVKKKVVRRKKTAAAAEEDA